MKMLHHELNQHRIQIQSLLRRYYDRGATLLLHSDIIDEWHEFQLNEVAQAAELDGTAFKKIILSTQEAVIAKPSAYFSIRKAPGKWHYLHFNTEEMTMTELSVAEFLTYKERLVDHVFSDEPHPLTFDLSPFSHHSPRLKEPKSIGRGVEFLNKYLSNRLFDNDGVGYTRLLEFLKRHQHKGQPLMLNERIADVTDLRDSLRTAILQLEKQSVTTTWDELRFSLQELGFEPGWGRTAKQAAETMTHLVDLLEAPDPLQLETFLARVPIIFKIAIISPHGYFGQANVLGLPDTGGQVVYILDQVRALEQRMCKLFYEQGLDIEPQILVATRLIPECGNTSCDQPLEAIYGTKYTNILRVPFREPDGQILPQWISRFEVWPYLERFSLDVEKELLANFGTTPELVIGNYSDGNLVASLLSRRLNATQCSIAHALEKTKYLHSDLYWQDNEQNYHFSAQFSADLLAMNSADFIIASTYQEIAGTADNVGQYESYSSFTMPGLYRVEHGIDPYHPKFNIVSPGADPEVFFSYTDKQRRIPHLSSKVAEMIDGEADPTSRGHLHKGDKPLLFAMSRLDHIKNMTGLLRWYGENSDLRQQVNLLLVGGQIDPTTSKDPDERYQIETTHALFEQFQLDGHVRWIEMQTDKNLVGELYRSVADRRGAFVQPALFEAFGLTVVEAMSCGLPVFATCYGGPREIIEDGHSGFHIDPNHGIDAANKILSFFQDTVKNHEVWDGISKGALERVAAKYTWQRYAQNLLKYTTIYSFWKYISNLERKEIQCYLDMFYSLFFKQRAALVGEQLNQVS